MILPVFIEILKFNHGEILPIIDAEQTCHAFEVLFDFALVQLLDQQSFYLRLKLNLFTLVRLYCIWVLNDNHVVSHKLLHYFLTVLLSLRNGIQLSIYFFLSIPFFCYEVLAEFFEPINLKLLLGLLSVIIDIRLNIAFSNFFINFFFDHQNVILRPF